LANHPLQDDTGVLQLLDLAGFFIQDFRRSPENTIDSATVWHHLGVKLHASIFISLVARGEDRFIAFHANPLSGLKIQLKRWRSLPNRDCPRAAGVRNSAPKALDPIVYPARQGRETVSEGHDAVLKKHVKETTCHPVQTYIP
jgi:hypothetical protein